MLSCKPDLQISKLLLHLALSFSFFFLQPLSASAQFVETLEVGHTTQLVFCDSAETTIEEQLFDYLGDMGYPVFLSTKELSGRPKLVQKQIPFVADDPIRYIINLREMNSGRCHPMTAVQEKLLMEYTRDFSNFVVQLYETHEPYKAAFDKTTCQPESRINKIWLPQVTIIREDLWKVDGPAECLNNFKSYLRFKD